MRRGQGCNPELDQDGVSLADFENVDLGRSDGRTCRRELATTVRLPGAIKPLPDVGQERPVRFLVPLQEVEVLDGQAEFPVADELLSLHTEGAAEVEEPVRSLGRGSCYCVVFSTQVPHAQCFGGVGLLAGCEWRVASCEADDVLLLPPVNCIHRPRGSEGCQNRITPQSVDAMTNGKRNAAWTGTGTQTPLELWPMI